MAKTVSATTAKSNFGALVESIARDGGEVIVENRGVPVVAMIPMSAYGELEQAQLEKRRQAALEKLRALQARVREKNPDLTAEDVADLAKRVVNDAIAALDEKHRAAGTR